MPGVAECFTETLLCYSNGQNCRGRRVSMFSILPIAQTGYQTYLWLLFFFKSLLISVFVGRYVVRY